MHEKHRGHESMHAIMLLILIGAMFITQIILIYWRKKHFKSYQNVSMFGMWIIPIFVSAYQQYWRFIIIWLFISTMTMFLIFRPLFYKNLSTNGSSIPRQVYRWFFYLYSISSIIAVSGYTIVMLTLLGVNILLGIKPMYTLDIGILLLFYGIYYGVLTRDFTDFLVDILAANIGYYSPSSSLPSKQLNSKTCAICGRPHGG
ncbi:RING finger protein 121-like protein, partial [Euroglyphus maynei]